MERNARGEKSPIRPCAAFLPYRTMELLTLRAFAQVLLWNRHLTISRLDKQSSSLHPRPLCSGAGCFPVISPYPLTRATVERKQRKSKNTEPANASTYLRKFLREDCKFLLQSIIGSALKISLQALFTMHVWKSIRIFRPFALGTIASLEGLQFDEYSL